MQQHLNTSIKSSHTLSGQVGWQTLFKNCIFALFVTKHKALCTGMHITSEFWVTSSTRLERQSQEWIRITSRKWLHSWHPYQKVYMASKSKGKEVADWYSLSSFCVTHSFVFCLIVHRASGRGSLHSRRLRQLLTLGQEAKRERWIIVHRFFPFIQSRTSATFKVAFPISGHQSRKSLMDNPEVWVWVTVGPIKVTVLTITAPQSRHSEGRL